MQWSKPIGGQLREVVASWEQTGRNTFTKAGWKITLGSDNLWYVHPPRSPGYNRGQAFGVAERMMADWQKQTPQR